MFVNNSRISVAFWGGATKVLHGLMVLMICVTFSCGIASIAHAELLYYDGIDYATGDLVGNSSNGTTSATYQFNGGWYNIVNGGTAIVTESNLTPDSGNGVTITPTTGTTFYGIRLGDATGANPVTIGDILPENNTLWFSYIGNLTTYGGRFWSGNLKKRSRHG